MCGVDTNRAPPARGGRRRFTSPTLLLSNTLQYMPGASDEEVAALDLEAEEDLPSAAEQAMEGEDEDSFIEDEAEEEDEAVRAPAKSKKKPRAPSKAPATGKRRSSSSSTMGSGATTTSVLVR